MQPLLDSSLPKTDTRETLRMAVVGRVGCGKSTIVRKLARAALQQHRRVLVLTGHDNEWLDLPMVHPRFPERIASYVGGRRIIVTSKQSAYEAIRIFRNGLLILDDCRMFLPPYPDTDLENLVISTRQKDVDLIVVCHGFSQLPPVFFTFVDYFVLFGTRGNIKERKNYFQDFKMIQEVVRDVNELSKSDPHTFKIIKNE